MLFSRWLLSTKMDPEARRSAIHNVSKTFCSSTAKTRSFALVLALVIAAAALIDASRFASGAPPKAPSYTIVRLDDLCGLFTDAYAWDINNLGHMVGQVDDGLSMWGAFWALTTSNGTTHTSLSILKGGNVAATGINDSQEIVGGGFDATGDHLGLFWSSPEADPVVLPPLPGHDQSNATAINNDGVICGISKTAGGGETTRAVAWRVNMIGETPVVFGPVALPDTGSGSRANSMNDNDASDIAVIAGEFIFPDNAAVAWGVQSLGDGTLAVVPTPAVVNPTAVANGINNQGVVCGSLAGSPVEAVVWSGSARRILSRSKFVMAAWANDISNSGVIVGTGSYQRNYERGERAVVWNSATSSMIVLETFLVAGSPFSHLSDAFAINDQGLIIGNGSIGNQRAAFLAVPK